jgi:hypothetical protein
LDNLLGPDFLYRYQARDKDKRGIPKLSVSSVVQNRMKKMPGAFRNIFPSERFEKPKHWEKIPVLDRRKRALWESLPWPASIRRLKGTASLDPRNIAVARAWIAGVIVFDITSFDYPGLYKYVGRVSKRLGTFVRCPPKGLIQSFVATSIKRGVPMISLYGPIVSACRRGDALLARSSELKDLFKNPASKAVSE